MTIKYTIKSAISEYEDKTTGQMKKRYQQIGVVLETQKGDLMLKIESMPLFAMKGGELWAYLNVPEDKPQAFTPAKSDVPDDLPF